MGPGPEGTFKDGRASEARFNEPTALAVASDGSIFVADFANGAIRRIQPDGLVTTIAAGLTGPTGVAVSGSGEVFFTDAPANRVGVIGADGKVRFVAGGGPVGLGTGSFADGAGENARFSLPAGIGITSRGELLIADKDNHRIRRVSREGIVSTFAGGGTPGGTDGAGGQASFSFPVGLAIDGDDNVFVTEQGQLRVRKISRDGQVTTVFNSNEGSSLAGIAIWKGDSLLVTDAERSQVLIISSKGVATALAGSGSLGAEDGKGSLASFHGPTGVAVGPDGSIYVADSFNNRIRRISEN